MSSLSQDGDYSTYLPYVKNGHCRHGGQSNMTSSGVELLQHDSGDVVSFGCFGGFQSVDYMVNAHKLVLMVQL